MIRIFASLVAAFLLLSAPARANYGEARASFQGLSPDEQSRVAVGLIASGDFEGMAEQGFTPRLYRAIRDFEQREGFIADGVLEPRQLRRLQEVSDAFYQRLGAQYVTHPDTGDRLLVPRGLFDSEKDTAEGVLFTRKDGMLSLVFLSFPDSKKSYDQLWSTLSRESGNKHIVYERRFNTRFVVTGTFGTSKFYTMMARTGRSTTGFTFSWGAPYEELGRKVSTFLANAWWAEQR